MINQFYYSQHYGIEKPAILTYGLKFTMLMPQDNEKQSGQSWQIACIAFCVTVCNANFLCLGNPLYPLQIAVNPCCIKISMLIKQSNFCDILKPTIAVFSPLVH